MEAVEREISREVQHHIASVWEDIARVSAPFLAVHGGRWGAARRWWGPDENRRPVEIDLVAEDPDGRLLFGEVKWNSPRRAGAIFRDLEQKIARLPFAQGREVVPMLWLPTSPEDLDADQVVTARQVLDAVR